jgi:hypothetical protein
MKEGREFTSSGIKEGNNLYKKRKFGFMLQRRRRERPMVNSTMGEEMRQICAGLNAMETT